MIQLRIDLPETWDLIDAQDVAAVEQAFVGNTTLIENIGTPDLVARLHRTMVDESGALAYVVMASLVVEYFEISGAPPEQAWSDEGQTYSVDIAPGLTVQFFSLRIPIYDLELGLVAVATFTTPNLPVVGDMEPGFRSIAESIRFERA